MVTFLPRLLPAGSAQPAAAWGQLAAAASAGAARLPWPPALCCTASSPTAAAAASGCTGATPAAQQWRRAFSSTAPRQQQQGGDPGAPQQLDPQQQQQPVPQQQPPQPSLRSLRAKANLEYNRARAAWRRELGALRRQWLEEHQAAAAAAAASRAADEQARAALAALRASQKEQDRGQGQLLREIRAAERQVEAVSGGIGWTRDLVFGCCNFGMTCTQRATRPPQRRSHDGRQPGSTSMQTWFRSQRLRGRARWYAHLAHALSLCNRRHPPPSPPKKTHQAERRLMMAFRAQIRRSILDQEKQRRWGAGGGVRLLSGAEGRGRGRGRWGRAA